MERPQRISVGLSIAEYENLQRIADKHRVSLAWVGRQAIAEFLARYEASDSKVLLPFREAEEYKE